MNDLEKHKIKKDAKVIAKLIGATSQADRGHLFSAMANQFDLRGEVPLSSLFAKVATTYFTRKKK